MDEEQLVTKSIRVLEDKTRATVRIGLGLHGHITVVFEHEAPGLAMQGASQIASDMLNKALETFEDVEWEGEPT